MVLKVSVSLETVAGDRIAEVATENVFPDMLGKYSLGSAEAALLEMLEVRVISPCRALIRAHVRKHREATGQSEREVPQVPARWGDNEVIAALNHRLGVVMAQTQSEVQAAFLPASESSR